MVNERITEKAIELLCRLIEVPRVSREETAAADLLQAYMQGELGLEVQREGNNLWSIAPDFDDKKQTLLLNAHIDTVKPVAGWQRDPFKEPGRAAASMGLAQMMMVPAWSLCFMFSPNWQSTPPKGEQGGGFTTLSFWRVPKRK